MPRTIRCQVSIPMDSLLPEDVVTNTLHFHDAGVAVAGSLEALAGAIATFYNSIDGPIIAASAGTLATLKMYDMSDPEPRQPLRTSTFALTPSTGLALPAEVAVCLSFAAAQESGLPAARRRGRIFIGPVSEAIVERISGHARPEGPARDTLVAAAVALAAAVRAIPDDVLEWAVYSPTDNVSRPVVSGWVDNAFDTVRSRGPAPTARTTFASP